MKSIGARLTFWYALTATASLAFLFVAGYFLLENRLIQGLDLLNAAEFKHLEARLGKDVKSLTAAEIDKRIRETTDYAGVLFYFTIGVPKGEILFSSTNLNGAEVPDIPGQRRFNATLPGIGELRVEEFVMASFDVHIGTPMGHVRETMRTYVQVCLGLLVVMILMSIFIGLGLSRMVLSPIRSIRETASHIGSDNLSERIPVGAVKDELSDLATLLNQTFDRLEASFDQIRRFSADASHELKTPLSLVRLHAERLLVSGRLAPAEEEAVHVQLEEIARLNAIIEDMLFLSRADVQAVKMTLKEQDPDEFIKTFLQDASVLAEHHGRQLTHTLAPSQPVAFEAKWMRQVLLNLLVNAIDASPPGGAIELRAGVDGEVWRISLDNEGPHLTEDQRARMFERFVRLNPGPADTRGSGLGLAICRSIVELHAGKIFAVSGAGGRGLSVVIEIPVHEPKKPAGIHV